MNGPQVAIELRQMLEKAGMAIPYICCCTAYGDQSFKREAINAGMHDFVTKPVDAFTLAEILKHLKD